jgi:hypothetical protein
VHVRVQRIFHSTTRDLSALKITMFLMDRCLETPEKADLYIEMEARNIKMLIYVLAVIGSKRL